jgi:hypothetical protein
MATQSSGHGTLRFIHNAVIINGMKYLGGDR